MLLYYREDLVNFDRVSESRSHEGKPVNLSLIITDFQEILQLILMPDGII